MGGHGEGDSADSRLTERPARGPGGSRDGCPERAGRGEDERLAAGSARHPPGRGSGETLLSELRAGSHTRIPDTSEIHKFGGMTSF